MCDRLFWVYRGAISRILHVPAEVRAIRTEHRRAWEAARNASPVSAGAVGRPRSVSEGIRKYPCDGNGYRERLRKEDLESFSPRILMMPAAPPGISSGHSGSPRAGGRGARCSSTPGLSAGSSESCRRSRRIGWWLSHRRSTSRSDCSGSRRHICSAQNTLAGCKR